MVKPACALLAICALSACTEPASRAPASVPAPGPSPKQMVRQLLEEGIGGAQPERIRPLLGASYTQHNPRVTDGTEGLLSFVESLKTAPEERRPKVKVLRVFQDGDFVFAHTEYRRRARVAGFDVFRLQDGRFVEHWDAGQQLPEESASGHTMLDGPTEATALEDTAANKALVRRFLEEVLVQGRTEALPGYFQGEALIQHSPRIADGVPALRQALESKDAPIRYAEVKRVLGEGSFVLAQSRGTAGEEAMVFYDLFRVERGKLAEHWDAAEEIPERAANANGML